jgi:hypothetical protein
LVSGVATLVDIVRRVDPGPSFSIEGNHFDIHEAQRSFRSVRVCACPEVQVRKLNVNKLGVFGTNQKSVATQQE